MPHPPTVFAWHPRAAILAYGVDRDGPAGLAVAVVSADGTCRVQRLDLVDPPTSLSWSPEGDALAVATGRRVYVVRAPGDQPLSGELIQEQEQGFTHRVELVWSSRGRHLAFAAGDPHARQLYVASRDQDFVATPVPLPEGFDKPEVSADMGLTWSPVAPVLAFSATEAGNKWRILVTEGGEPARTISSLDADGASPVDGWSPLGHRFAYRAATCCGEGPLRGHIEAATLPGSAEGHLRLSPSGLLLAQRFTWQNDDGGWLVRQERDAVTLDRIDLSPTLERRRRYEASGCGLFDIHAPSEHALIWCRQGEGTTLAALGPEDDEPRELARWSRRMWSSTPPLRWSVDGQYAVVPYDGGEDAKGLLEVRVVEGEALTLDHAARHGHPNQNDFVAWRPDGRAYAYRPVRDGADGLAVRRVDTRETVTLVEPGSVDWVLGVKWSRQPL